ncbi:hypothetical protein PoB_005739200 [Plakobranchus ocellatus]|uniref:Uncharacterized protein n=1 Tax=Plakobranchus ocellatus TaxID=259542 RepID=A0AAV4CHV3_9GAST|nr:hypothetical protein PoB_005739200 [Plakobranchus ocellatus]
MDLSRGETMEVFKPNISPGWLTTPSSSCIYRSHGSRDLRVATSQPSIPSCPALFPRKWEQPENCTDAVKCPALFPSKWEQPENCTNAVKWPAHFRSGRGISS